MKINPKIIVAVLVLAVSACSRSPEEQCIASKTDALKTALPYMMALMKGARGMAIPGRIEADKAINKVKIACNNPNYSLSDLIEESELTEAGFVLKQRKNKVNQTSNIKSSDTEFSGAKLGGKVRDYFFGEKLEVDGGPYFFTANKALIGYEYDEKIKYENQGYDQKIQSITYQCRDYSFPASSGGWSIDDFDCESDVSSLENSNWQKLCRVHTFGSINQPFQNIFLKNNAFITAYSNKIDAYGIYSNKNQFNFAYKPCDQAEKLKTEAVKNGFESIGDYLQSISIDKK
jgi:hypothetical protein